MILDRPERLTDDEWMRRLEAGDVEHALAALQTRYRARIESYVQRFVRDEHLTQDVTQEVFARVFLKSHLYRQGTCFRAWLFEIAKNQAMSALRVRRRTPTPISTLGTEEDANLLAEMVVAQPDRAAEERELMDAFHRAVASLPESYQAVFHLCMNRGLDYQQAADLLGIPLGTVAIRLMRARQRLFRALEPLLDRLRRPPACLRPL